jgi:hypothetical protein
MNYDKHGSTAKEQADHFFTSCNFQHSGLCTERLTNKPTSGLRIPKGYKLNDNMFQFHQSGKLLSTLIS